MLQAYIGKSRLKSLEIYGFFPVISLVLHIFPYLLFALNPLAKYPPCWTWIPQSILGLFGSPRPCGSVKPRTIFFFSDQKENTSGVTWLGSKFNFDLISFIFGFILFLFYILLSLVFILKRKIRNKPKSKNKKITKIIPTNLNIFNGSSRPPEDKTKPNTTELPYFYYNG